MTFVLDTDVFSLAYYGTHGIRERIASERRAHQVVVSTGTRVEVLRGRIGAIRTAADGPALFRAVKGLRVSEAYLSGFVVLPFDPASIVAFDRLRVEKTVRKVDRGDLLIACIAIANGATVVTRNTKDFTLIPGVKFVNWAD
jgi:tRNA(fMet)-specific endonuclease VapC